ncbi:hypothetical protein Dgeo_3092 (plasmid) [Deinococcus geothermalis DSM 11300]|uniref:Uncharacterized protein n=1 Tax=Deinococcus geothermalis (strain DSM 11300 / CIP 105573 / AG-3a) TaxID=319795 RepID=A8ZRM4_DEIGD|nr:hypothetical protein [Deinococcus sp. S9]ABW35133.1 hypothetical protein Dgeo_3092 [Deinococcus geothermalis DSM 11300]TDE84644.1 hypothetical protein E0686_16110 [Deinococcus sp. S9]
MPPPPRQAQRGPSKHRRSTTPTDNTPAVPITPAPVAPAATTPSRSQAAPQPGHPPRGPNPNRLGINRNSATRSTLQQGARLVDASKVDLSATARRRNGRPGARHTTITLTSAPSKDAPGVFLIGLCIKDETGLRFDVHPTPGPLDDALPLALENAVLRCPALRDLVIVTPYKSLWNPANHTKATRDFVRQHGCRLTHAHPMPFDLGNMLAQAAARGESGPRRVDFHLYTASITDGARTYVSGILYGKSRAYQFTQTLPHASLAAAEAAVSQWAFRLMPENTDVMVHNANPIMQGVWENPKGCPPDVREVMKGVGQQIRLKNLKFKQGIEPYVANIARAAREIASHAYAGANLRAPLPAAPRKQEPA